MSAVSIEAIKNLRAATGAGVMAAKGALEESGGDVRQAKELLKKEGMVKVVQKSARTAGEGRVTAYIHATGKIGSLLELFCETDFVARTPEFQNLAKELSLQIAATDPQDRGALLEQEYIRDPSKTVQDLINETIARVGENIKVGRMVRFEI